MIDGIVSRVASSLDELRELLEPVHTLVDLTGDKPVVTIAHGSVAAAPEAKEGATPPPS